MYIYIYVHTYISLICGKRFVIFQEKLLKALKFSMSVTTTQLLYSGEFCKLHCDTKPVKSAYANVSFYTSNSKMPNIEL